MKSIGKITEELINRSPFIREAMTDDLINISALARKLRPDIESYTGKEVKEGAIIMAIKRMTPGLYHRLNVKLTSVIGELGDFLVRSNLADFTFENSSTIREKQVELMKAISSDHDNFFTICKGVTETTIICNTANADMIKQVFAKENMKCSNNNLASVTVKLPKVNTEIYGVYYYLLKHLAWEGINIVEVVSTSNEFTIIVKGDDVDQAFRILMNLKRLN